MRILVNDVAASQGGAKSVLESFYAYVSESDSCMKNEWLFLISDRYLEEKDQIKVEIIKKVKKNWINRLIYELFEVKKISKSFQADVVLSLQNIISFGVKVPQVVYIHQSIPFQNIKKFSFFKREEFIYAVYQYVIGALIKLSARKAKRVVVQTEWMRKAVSIKAKCEKSKVVVVPSTNQNVPLKYCEDRFDSNHFFYPAFDSIYKNQLVIEQACREIEKYGYEELKVELTTERKYEVKGLSGIGTLSYEQVLLKYQSATLIFPSYIETVGLPLVEAMQIGTIILAADCPYAHETLGKYENAYYFNPFEAHELAQLMMAVMKGEIQKKEKKEHINNHTNMWEKVLEEIETLMIE